MFSDEYESFGGSTTTLLPPYLPPYSAEQTGSIILRPSQDNPCNCTFYCGDEPLYTTSTTNGKNPVITIKRANVVVGTIEWNDAIGDKITVSGQPGKRFRPFFRVQFPGGTSLYKKGSIQDASGATWTWYGHTSRRQLALIGPSTGFAAKWVGPDPKRTEDPAASLEILPAGFGVQELIIATFVAIEKKRFADTGPPPARDARRRQ